MPSHPAKIGKYTVEAVLGRGGMGIVYKAVDPQIGRYVAIKMITSGGDHSLLDRFRSEARSTGSLQCPNIVTVYDFGEQDGNPYLVMQFLEGSSLDSLIHSGASLSLSERLGIMIDVCNGLAYAHQRGVIHRDIKPGNIMVLQDGVNDGMAVIVDFGIARIGGDTRLTRTDQIVGSVHYMSVEQLQAKELDNRADIYATGVVLFQLLTGSLPFDGTETAATLLKIVNDPPPPLSTYLKEYPVELESIIGKALAKRREERYPTAKDLAFDLMQVQERVKSETVTQLVRRAEVSVGREEWTRAREQLQQVLRIDRENTQAQKLMNAVQAQLRQRQQIEQARALRSQADEANMDRRYDDALRLLDQAITLDPKNTGFVSFRESVRSAKDRAAGLQQALQRAESALQDGDLEEAQSAVNEAFQIDPHDTQAKALKVIIGQQFEEKSRQEQMRNLLDQARNQIAEHDLTGAYATLQAAEAIDPTSTELQTVGRMAASAREQEKRRAETEELRRQIEAALVQEDYAAAVAKADEGLRKAPHEQTFLKLKSLAEAQRARIELKRFVREQSAAATSFMDAGQPRQALAVLERALQRAPGNLELETLRSTVRDVVAAEESEQQKLQAAGSALAEGKKILQQRGARSAREFLDARANQFAESPQLRELYDAVCAREALDVLDSRLATESNPARRVELAEDSVHANPENHWIRQRLGELQQVKARIDAAIDRAHKLEAAGNLVEALREWQQLKNAYPQVPEFESHIQRIGTLRRGAKAERKAPVTKAPPIEPGPGRIPEEISATRMLDPAALRASINASMKSTPAVREPDIESVKEKAALPAVGSTAPPRPPATGVQGRPVTPVAKPNQLATLLAGPSKYIVGAAAVVVLVVVSYLAFGGHKKTKGSVSAAAIEVDIVTTPPDASITHDSVPLPDRTVSITPGASVAVDVARLGYKTKRVEVREAADGNIVLEPEPLHLSIQAPEKTGTVELDGRKISDLSDGSADDSELLPDGNRHKLSVMVRGKPLFTLELQATPGSPPQVTAFDVNGLFLITSLGSNARVYAGNFLKNVRLGDQNIAVSPAGADLSLREDSSEIKFGEGNEQGSLTIERSNAPTLAIHSIDMDGQVLVTSNVDGATLTVNKTAVKRQQRGWLVSRPQGTYNFALSAEGYEPQVWTMDLQRRQTLTKKVDLKAKARAATTSPLVIVGGTPEAEVEIDGKRVAALDATGNLQLPGALTDGQHSIALAKPYFDGRSFEVSAKAPGEVRIPDAKLIPWPIVAFETTVPNATVKYQRAGDSQFQSVPASTKLRLPLGRYTIVAEASGFQPYGIELKLGSGNNVNVPLKLIPILDYEFQDPTQVIHDGPWVRLIRIECFPTPFS